MNLIIGRKYFMDLKENKYVFIGMIIFVVPMLMFLFEMLGRVWR